MTDNPHTPPNEPDDVAKDSAGSSYEPSYSEPSWDTTSKDSGGESIPASASDSDSVAQGGPSAQPGQTFGGAPADPGHQAPYGQSAQQTPNDGPMPSQQAPQAGPPQGQQYQQQGQPMGGMPPQDYSGGYGMATGQNPNYLVGPTEQGRNTLQLDYWLSVFFSWIPSLIFFLTERDKNRLVDEHTKELMNFNITRVIVGATVAIPFIGWILGGIGSIVLFVMAIIGAIKGPDEYANGRPYKFPLTFRFIK